MFVFLVSSLGNPISVSSSCLLKDGIGVCCLQRGLPSVVEVGMGCSFGVWSDSSISFLEVGEIDHTSLSLKSVKDRN